MLMMLRLAADSRGGSYWEKKNSVQDYLQLIKSFTHSAATSSMVNTQLEEGNLIQCVMP